VFAYLLTRIDADFAGRAYAAYGGVYIASSLLWLWAVEGMRPDRWDLTGGTICLLGTAIILPDYPQSSAILQADTTIFS